MVANPISPIDCLRELAAALERGEAPPVAVGDRIVAAIRRVEEQADDESMTLDAAFGVSPSEWKQERRHRRNAIIRQARDHYLNGVSLREAGKRIAALGRELQSGRMRSTSGGLPELLREALGLGIPFPTSGRQVQNILNDRGK
jgi:hypothetical protein